MIRTLIIEDDPMVMQINERFLGKVNGYEHIGSVSSLNEAKNMILSLKPELILLDIFFPTGRGVEIIHWLREQDLQTDVIFITADRNTKTIEKAFRFGAVDYLIKPFRFDRFEEALIKYKNLRATYAADENMDQSSIDNISATMKKKVGPDSDREKALEEGNQTHHDILDFLRINKASGFTAQEVADQLGISRITARRYLDELESDGKLELFLEYGKVGRPRNKYRSKDWNKENEIEWI